MIVWGGQGETYVPLNTGGRYNPSTNGIGSHQHDKRAGRTPVTDRNLDRK